MYGSNSQIVYILKAQVPGGSMPPPPTPCNVLNCFLCHQVYYLASVRLRDLCERLEVDSELRSRIWTGFENTLMQHIDLMQVGLYVSYIAGFMLLLEGEDIDWHVSYTVRRLR